MKLSRGTLSLLTVLVIFLILGAGIGWRMMSGEEGDQQARPELPDTEGVQVESALQFAGAQPVEGAEVIQDTLWIPVIAAGEAAANRQSRVATRTSGLVERVFVRENDLVQAGDILIQLDTTEAAMELLQAQSALLTAQSDYEERMLFSDDDPLLTQEERVERERHVRALSGLNQAEANLERARMEMEWTRVRAPFGGRVADLEAVEGAFMGTGAEVLTLLELNPIKIHMQALEGEVPMLAAGRRATVLMSAAFPGEAFTARVESVNPLVDREAGGQSRVTLVMPNPGHRIHPGMYAQVSVDAQAYPNRIMIPREAVVERDRGAGRAQVVFVASRLDESGNGIAEWRYVATGRFNQTHIEVLVDPDVLAAEGADRIEPGEIVLVTGHHFLAHDTEIRLVDNVLAAGGRPGG